MTNRTKAASLAVVPTATSPIKAPWAAFARNYVADPARNAKQAYEDGIWQET